MVEVHMIDGHIHIEKGDYSLDWINEFVKYAIQRGMREIHLLEHSHRFKEFKDMYNVVADYNDYQNEWLNRKMTLSIEDYKKFIYDVRHEQFPISVKFGLEVCYIENTEEMVNNILDDFDWDFITGSVHWIDGWGFDHKKEFWNGKDVDVQYAKYYKTMKKLIKSGLFTVLAHPDSIKCFGYQPSIEFTDTYTELADLLNEHKMTVEQSAGLYLNYGHKELGMNKRMLDIFKQKGVSILTASDAHVPENTGKFIKELYKIMENME
jgi:Histidinol phosphatase and related hydrolases of the PHP family